MADDDSSELSSLSSLSPAPSDDESDIQLKQEKGILKFFHRVPKSASLSPAVEMSPPPTKRAPSPPHEYALADDKDIAVRDARVCRVELAVGRERSRCEPPTTTRLTFLPQFIVMFRNRFSEAFPKNLPNFGPQELERDVVDAVPGDRVEHFLCALLKLLLNRQQDVKYEPTSPPWHRGPPHPAPRKLTVES